MTVSAGEYGRKKIRINAGYDLSAATALSVTGKKPDGSAVNWTGLTRGTVDVVTELGTFLADEYAEHVLALGDVDLAGLYELKLVAAFADGTLKSTIVDLVVEE